MFFILLIWLFPAIIGTLLTWAGLGFVWEYLFQSNPYAVFIAACLCFVGFCLHVRHTYRNYPHRKAQREAKKAARRG